MIVNINDDFDLYRIVESGQCFRPVNLGDDVYRFIYQDNVLYIKNLEANEYEVSCSKEEWEKVWINYFNLEISYADIRRGITDDTYMKKCADNSIGIRILKQDKWEMLISYIISQRKSIPAIRSSIEKICRLCGNEIQTQYESIYLFPDAKMLMNADVDELAACGLGYRLTYIVEAAKFISQNPGFLDEIDELDDIQLFDKLISFKGVGMKVANCVMLFAYNRTGRAPVDVWIQRVIDEEYNGLNPFDNYGDYAGIMQQYVFFYRRLIEDK